MSAPRVISLDLDDTLWPVAPVIAAAEAALLTWLREHHPRAVQGMDVGSMRELRARVAERFPGKSHDLTFLRRQALAEMFAAAGYRGGRAADDAFEIFLSERNRVEFYADVRPALLRLRATYRLFALSNGNADLTRCGIADLFDGHVTASAAGAAKPDARIFAHLLRAAHVRPIEVLHVGDDPLADVIGAMQAGMQAVWLNREARAWPEHFAPPSRTVTTLAELL
ncbi:MAG TPA: HAD family hydrolase [Steroidobacteraceae bacterium]|nr:HAD family hydrolase [Steroidobacteraceae bacterium]